MNTKSAAGALVACLLLSGSSVLRAQHVGAADSDRRAAVEAAFARDLAKAEADKITGLGELAARRPDAEAAEIYVDLFRFAIATEQYAAAEPFAVRAAERSGMPAETLLTARLVELVARAERGDFDGAVARLARGVNEGLDAAKAAKIDRALPLPARLSLLNAFTQRLIHRGRYDVARRALTVVADGSREPRIKELAAERLAQLELVGKPAPSFAGVDLDGKPVDSADLKGKVVLVLFWASWCPDNVAEAARFGEILKEHEAKGFRIVGINVDARRDGGVPVDSVMPAVRRFVAEHDVRWPNLMNGEGEKDYAARFRVAQLPSDVLIGRDGAVRHLDVDVARLRAALKEELPR